MLKNSERSDKDRSGSDLVGEWFHLQEQSNRGSTEATKRMSAISRELHLREEEERSQTHKPRKTSRKNNPN